MEEEANLAGISSKPNLLKRYKLLVITLGVVITLFGALTLALVIYTRDSGEIANGVVLEIPLGKLSIEDARSKLVRKRKEILDRPVHFTTEGKRFSINMKELGLTYTYDAALQQAYLIGRNGTIFEKAISKFKASWGITLNPEYQWNDLLLAEALHKYLSALNNPAEDARFTIKSDNTMEIISEKSGRQVDIASLSSSVKKLTLNQTDSIPIPFKTILPAINKKELETLKTTSLLSKYTTRFNSNQTGRTQNIKLAAKAIDGTVLKPKQTFSFNQTVGQRTAEAGYQMAMIIEGNEFVPGLGGGICQVSSTLYNAVQLAGLSVSERSHHSLAVTYVPPGQDATVAYPNLDFKFINDSGTYLLIRSIVDDDTLTFYLYGPLAKEKY